VEDLGLEPHAPTPEPLGAAPPGDPVHHASGDPTASADGRIARARRSAEQLEQRAKTEFERARERHASVRLVAKRSRATGDVRAACSRVASPTRSSCGRSRWSFS
jgi:hypothetical protein